MRREMELNRYSPGMLLVPGSEQMERELRDILCQCIPGEQMQKVWDELLLIRSTRGESAEQVLIEHMSHRTWFHCHGHVSSNPNAPFESSISIGSGVEISAEEILKHERMASTIVLIGCSSALHQVLHGDEPLGLLSSLFRASAKSIVGSLWSLLTVESWEFTQHFYRAVKERPLRPLAPIPVAENKALFRYVDLARCLQTATLRMLETYGQSNIHAWAGYTLWGSWFTNADDRETDVENWISTHHSDSVIDNLLYAHPGDWITIIPQPSAPSADYSQQVSSRGGNLGPPLHRLLLGIDREKGQITLGTEKDGFP